MSQSNNSQVPIGFSIRQKLGPFPGGIYRLAWSPNGKFLAALSKGSSVHFWDAEKGQLTRVLEGHAKRTLALAWSNDSQTLAVGVENLITLTNVSGHLYRSFKNSFSVITALAWSPDDSIIAVGHTDGSLQFWKPATGALLWDEGKSHFDDSKGHTDRITKLLWSRDGLNLISSSADASIKVWEPHRKLLSSSLQDESGVNSIALAPYRKALVSASSARTIRLWDLQTNRDISVIEGHTDLVKDLTYSADGSILASISQDHTIRFWRCEDWTMVAMLHSSQSISASQGVAYHPTTDSIAILDANDSIIQIWDVDSATVLNSTATESVQYTTGKIALVGDSGVGKTGIGWRLAHGEFKEHSSTHGQQFWVIDAFSSTRSDGTQCEAVLWDFAGQPDYRLLHSLFLDDVDLALVVFDPTNRQDPLKGVEFWLKQLSHRSSTPCYVILVGARIDRGSLTLTTDELKNFVTTMAYWAVALLRARDRVRA